MNTRFRIAGLPDAQTLMRVLGPFAQRGLLASAVHARLVGDLLEIQLEIEGMDDAGAGVILAKLASSVLVESANIEAIADVEGLPA